MDSAIYKPLTDFEDKIRDRHAQKTMAFFDAVVESSGVNADENRKTVNDYNTYKNSSATLKKKLNKWRVLRVLMIISIVLIAPVILKITPKIRALREELASADAKANELLNLAYEQMKPLTQLFTRQDSLNIIHEVIPALSFDTCFSAEKEADMKINYDFAGNANINESTVDLLAGAYNENPFLFENKKIHKMGTETYHGYKTVSWTERYRASDGKMRQRTRTQTLHASVVKPKPYYRTQAVLHYGSQAGPELSFSRDASGLNRLSEKALEKHVKRGEKKLKKRTDRAIKQNEAFMSMANTDFEVLFDALDRTNEVQFRALFTPLAQTNTVDLILSDAGFGDDFDFFKTKRMNTIVSKHSQGRGLVLTPEEYASYSFDIIKENFTRKNAEFFKAIYFDFAPLLAIPAYQERPVHSLKPIPESSQRFSLNEDEALANALDSKYTVHPSSKTEAIIKAEFSEGGSDGDEISVTAYSYDIEKRVEVVPVMAGDGKYHNVPVEWDEYLPLEAKNSFYVKMHGSDAMASRNGIGIYNKN